MAKIQTEERGGGSGLHIGDRVTMSEQVLCVRRWPARLSPSLGFIAAAMVLAGTQTLVLAALLIRGILASAATTRPETGP